MAPRRKANQAGIFATGVRGIIRRHSSARHNEGLCAMSVATQPPMIKLAKNSHRTAQARPSSSQRVISPVSDAHRHAGNSNIGTASLKTTSEIPSVLGYSNRSKLARILSQGHLAENRPVLMVVAIQPDVAFTNLTEGSSRWFAG
ncbi:uncharacterized protein VDAG_05403 [Verticillium dahliae VdLs.17]|uniref:Uncharacterized protein n=1 Tax=Verticillium dahliae (strain VdLs.17 / ATCC MYA-4575 / FGSC 10137) TaxID=498257 RepID=G2X598_VERDV|nr:uncharacterized protein VDAG_05403 [Verticillium dahliae VdLs.17]EGY14239.1 hypothetical protein VDAG_05403 [Verticillium dahliae VdLs.17]